VFLEVIQSKTNQTVYNTFFPCLHGLNSLTQNNSSTCPYQTAPPSAYRTSFPDALRNGGLNSLLICSYINYFSKPLFLIKLDVLCDLLDEAAYSSSHQCCARHQQMGFNSCRKVSYTATGPASLQL